jgi:hypothetical protein
MVKGLNESHAALPLFERGQGCVNSCLSCCKHPTGNEYAPLLF